MFDQMYTMIPKRSAYSLDLSIKFDPFISQNLLQFLDISGSITPSETHCEEATKLKNVFLQEKFKPSLTSLKKILLDISSKEKISMKVQKVIYLFIYFSLHFISFFIS